MNPLQKNHYALELGEIVLSAFNSKRCGCMRTVLKLFLFFHVFFQIPREEAEKSWMTEMSAGLDQASDSSPEFGDYSTVNPPVQRKKKTLQKRRKLREERERKRALEAKKMEKKKRADVNDKLVVLKKAIDKKEVLSSAYQKRKQERKDSKVRKQVLIGNVFTLKK